MVVERGGRAMRRWCEILVFVVLLGGGFAVTPQCRNEKGEPVDWFYVYKLPRERNHLNPLVRRGVAYMHLTPSKLRGGWMMSDMSIADPRSMVGRTLSPLYQNKNMISVVYNDQPPAGESQPDILQNVAEMYSKSKRGQLKQASIRKYKKFKLGDKYYDDYDLAEMCKMHSKFMKNRVESGHTKGVILGDKFTSLWLVHSVPRFPPIPDAIHDFNTSSYDYPTTGMKYGQSFLCVSVQTSTLNQIATQLKYNEPLIVYSYVPQEFENELPNLMDVLKNKTIEVSPWYHIESFETLVGRKFLSFAKSAMFNDDLYSGLVAEVLQSDLLVESWTNGPGTLDSECSRNFQVRNIERLKFPIAKMSFTSHNDHSKWAVAVAHKMHNSQDTKVADYWVCVGDINRALPQESRGGGTVCTSGPILWGNFAHLIEWVIYKPPAGLGPWETGANFSYISSQSAGVWTPSERLITTSNMLKNTLAPMYRLTYTDYLAVLTYHPKEGDEQNAGSVAMGVMMADEMGGVWIAHTVPGLPDLSRDRFKFPEEELVNGHLIFCLSGDFVTLNEIAKTLREVDPRVVTARVPEKVREWLPDWLSLNEPIRVPLSSKVLPRKTNIVSSGSTLRGELTVRRPGDRRCLYQLFAQSRNIVLDVYGHYQLMEPICDTKYGLRKIDAISLNYPNTINDNNKHVQVVYVNNQTDKVEFAVSTAAPWQKKGGSAKPEYWACIGTSAKEYHQAKGAFILCVEDYDFWRSFDILKVKEPEC